LLLETGPPLSSRLATHTQVGAEPRRSSLLHIHIFMGDVGESVWEWVREGGVIRSIFKGIDRRSRTPDANRSRALSQHAAPPHNADTANREISLLASLRRYSGVECGRISTGWAVSAVPNWTRDYRSSAPDPADSWEFVGKELRKYI